MKFYIETYGCQMNIYDSEIICSILLKSGFIKTSTLKKADIILLNTCAIREKPEKKIFNRLMKIRCLKQTNNQIKIGLVGCLATHYNKQTLEKLNFIDLIVGPDSYKKIPKMIKNLKKEQTKKEIDVSLANQEKYTKIIPIGVRTSISAFLSIMRGCDNMCTFCIVPFSRGREKSRNPNSILKECKILYKKGYKEIILLGQNVDSYFFKQIKFLNLLELIAITVPLMRIRFLTSYPSNISKNLLEVVKKHSNICKHFHIPLQSGSTRILSLMRRKYTVEEFLLIIKMIKQIIPDCSISSDLMTGFCTETQEDHRETIRIMNIIKFNFSYMFKYSSRQGTYAYRKLKDDVPNILKLRRLNEILMLQKSHSFYRLKENIGKIQNVLIEGISKKDDNYYYGRNYKNDIIVFPKTKSKIGSYNRVKILNSTFTTLIGERILSEI
ncbi:tRNA (N6-isopentenyl adenosine(37)-C2)-methylthiotransferase MiaB [Candidatus Karelsulcia muelleri]|nr:tRNA (N6-isopentenyl adenosine(37)-C2)-methylthiotransferase MiaB [Candidatus Karelsulcia muelleri]WDI79616.1 tRNA (N6-isopentenyl adenosine(37)-C2)-methylthiotransferase MiaB [Candidatus Karelsulcia muelleri]WDR78938.1 tRNA (N6-isopentenyl adenosine(37)-C2)-methylthiotransferase MiaB [Candidatus Karelsulcia muelleri]